MAVPLSTGLGTRLVACSLAPTFIAVNPIFSVRSCNTCGILGLQNPQSQILELGKLVRHCNPCHLCRVAGDTVIPYCMWVPTVVRHVANCYTPFTLLYVTVFDVVLQGVVNVWDIEAVYFDCALYMFTVLLAVMTRYQLRSAFMLTSFVIFPAICRVIFWKLFRAAPNSNYFSFHIWLIIRHDYCLQCFDIVGGPSKRASGL